MYFFTILLFLLSLLPLYFSSFLAFSFVFAYLFLLLLSRLFTFTAVFYNHLSFFTSCVCFHFSLLYSIAYSTFSPIFLTSYWCFFIFLCIYFEAYLYSFTVFMYFSLLHCFPILPYLCYLLVFAFILFLLPNTGYTCCHFYLSSILSISFSIFLYSLFFL